MLREFPDASLQVLHVVGEALSLRRKGIDARAGIRLRFLHAFLNFRKRRAEMAEHSHEFFGCEMRESILGGKSVWASPREATQSICGCNFENLLFCIRGERIRVALSRAAGDSLESLPLVDRDWHDFILQAGARIQGANRAQRVEKFLNQAIQGRILDSPDRFARVGITRVDENGCCWLMLDSLFPGPKEEWLEELR